MPAFPLLEAGAHGGGYNMKVIDQLEAWDSTIIETNARDEDIAERFFSDTTDLNPLQQIRIASKFISLIAKRSLASTVAATVVVGAISEGLRTIAGLISTLNPEDGPLENLEGLPGQLLELLRDNETPQ
jgi:hypothetical protein